MIGRWLPAHSFAGAVGILDTAGRVFCVGSGGIWVVEPDGTVVGVIGPEAPRNVAFGGPDFRTVYTTPGDSLYSFRVKTPGIAPY